MLNWYLINSKLILNIVMKDHFSFLGKDAIGIQKKKWSFFLLDKCWIIIGDGMVPKINHEMLALNE